MPKILIIEDDPDLGVVLSDELRFEHHLVEVAEDGADGLERILCHQFDLVILDWRLPGMSGVDICREVRDRKLTVPIIMLTGMRTLGDKEQGFGAGADDYVTKPCDVKEVALRVRALLRRAAGLSQTNLCIGDLELDPVKYRVTRGGEEIILLPTEFALLEFLMRHPDQFFSAEALLSRVWSSNADVTDEALRSCLKRLRKKIETCSDDPLIENIRNVGYRLRSCR